MSILRGSIVLVVCVLGACGPVESALTSSPAGKTPLRLETLPAATRENSPTPTSTLSPTPIPTATPIHLLADSSPFQRVASVADLLSDSHGRIQLFAPTDGSVWMIPLAGFEEQGVVRWEPEQAHVVFTREADTLVTVDHAGRAWVLRREADGIEMWERGRWSVYGSELGWIDGAAVDDIWWAPRRWHVVPDGQGRVWLPTQWDIRVFDGVRWSIYTTLDLHLLEPELKEFGIDRTIAVSKGGDRVWMAECQYSPLGPMRFGGLRWFDGSNWRGADAPIEPACVSVITLGPDGELWAGTIDLLWRYQPESGVWTTYRLPEAAQFGGNFSYLSDLVVDRNGEVWAIVHLCGGANCDFQSYLYHLHDGQGTVVLEPSDWWEPPKDLFSGPDGRIWLLWEGMFYQIEAGELIPISALQPRGMALDPEGRVWALVGYKDQAALWVLDLLQGE